MKVFDEFKTVWRVEAGDPARVLVNRLKKLRYDTVVLPRQVLLTGELGEAVPEPPTDVSPSDLPFVLRLADCDKELRA